MWLNLSAKEVFPEIAKEKNIKIINKNEIHDATKTKIHPLENKKNFSQTLPKEFIISYEALYSRSCEFSLSEISFEHIKKNFSDDTKILIIVRKPYDFLNSNYVQSILSAIDIKKPEDFFYIENSHNQRKNGKYNLYNFNYDHLIYLYRSYFKNVYVVKYEEIHNLIYLQDIFNLDENFIKKIKSKQKIVHNRALSATGVKFILFLNKFINLNKYQKFFTTYTKKDDIKIVRIWKKILSFFLLRVFLQYFLDKIIPYKKYYIDKKYIPIDIDKIDRNYENAKY